VPSSGGTGGAPPVRVLIVDDEIELRESLATFLRRVGCEVMTACEGGEGLQLLFNHHFDVVVSDLTMEPMDGITFLDEARKIWPWMGVVIISGYLDESRYSRAAVLGMSPILSKPFSVTDLQSAVFAEANRMREIVGSGRNESIQILRYQLSLLGESTRSAIEAISLEQALEQLSLNLAKALPSAATAIMCLPVADGQPILAVSARDKIAPAYLARLQDLIRERYRKLSGTDMPPDLELRIQEEQISPDGIPAFDNAVTFPLIDRGVVIGILAFVLPVGYDCSESDTLFLYNAANHVTTVLMAFFRIRNVAAHDQLTGLYNRHHLKDAFKSIWGMARRHGYYVGVMMIDIDHYKSVNDSYGHTVGDEVLREVSGLVRSAFRSSDLLVRYGGDELVVILPDATSEGLESSSRRLLDLVREHAFSKDSLALHCTISIGAAGINLGDEVDVDGETLLARADEAMYAAKLNGRDRYEIWSNRDPRQAPDDKKSPADTPPPIIQSVCCAGG
jgi:diguanylate cyclase (GGDEF)-like protein